MTLRALLCDYAGCRAVLHNARLEERSEVSALEAEVQRAETEIWSDGECAASAWSTRITLRRPLVSSDAFWNSLEWEEANDLDLESAEFIAERHREWAAGRRLALKREWAAIDWNAWANNGAAADRSWTCHGNSFFGIDRTVADILNERYLADPPSGLMSGLAMRKHSESDDGIEARFSSYLNIIQTTPAHLHLYGDDAAETEDGDIP